MHNFAYPRNYRNRNQENGCVLPEQPEGGHYKLGGCDEYCTKRPGDMVPKNSILNFTCKSNYILKGNTISVCVDNEWYQPPSCHSKSISTACLPSEAPDDINVSARSNILLI